MTWEAPAFFEIRMDAEVSAYQDDLAPSLPAREPFPVRKASPLNQSP